MKYYRKQKIAIFIIAFAFIVYLGVFTVRFIKNGENWVYHQSNAHIYKNGELIGIGEITDRDNNILAKTKDGHRVYNDDINIRKATLHTVGDSMGYISTGVQVALRDRLTGYNRLNGLYTVTNKGNNAQLTISSAVSVAAMNALGNKSGCVGVCNYKTGEVICIVSAPTFDIQNSTEFSAAKDGSLGSVYVNRFLSSTYIPGSTFKMVTAAAAIETKADIYQTTFICDYGTVIENEKLSCVGKHGVVGLERGFSHSCNAYFSQLGLSVGRSNLTKYAEMFGFNKQFSIDGINAATSTFAVSDIRNIDYGWASIGQNSVQMNPLQYLCAVSAVANGGSYNKPYLIKNITDSNGKTIYTAKSEKVKMLNDDTAQKIAALMDFAVTDNYKKESFAGLDVCGKTGTAEMGGGVENSLFIGFCKDADLPLAFVVVVEDGGSGNGSALRVAAKVLASAKNEIR